MLENVKKEVYEKSEKIYFIENGYYYHKNINCKGLEDCYGIKEEHMYKILRGELDLEPCNWCIE